MSAFEIGYARAEKIPIFSYDPIDRTLIESPHVWHELMGALVIEKPEGIVRRIKNNEMHTDQPWCAIKGAGES